MKETVIFNAMETNILACLSKFNTACSELIASKYIIANGKISKLMQSIAGGKPLFQLFNRITENYNFLNAFEKSKFRDEFSALYLKLPQDNTERLRFTFCLLFAIDTGRLELKTLLNSFYKNENPNIEFNRFCNEIIVPFKTLVNDFLCGKLDLNEPEKIQQNDVAATAEPIPPVEQKPKETIPNRNDDGNLDELSIANLSQITSEIIGLVSRENTLPTPERNEILLICDSFAEAVAYGSIPTIKIMYIALKNTLKCSSIYRSLAMQYKNLSDLIEEYEV